jgi:hypothetical protein
MGRDLHADIEIQATPERVWEVLTDFGAYPDWNPFMIQAVGQPTVGSRLLVRMRPPGRRATTFRPQVLEAEPGRKLRWLGRLLVPGIFDGEHSFTIQPIGPDRVRLAQDERFRGLFAPVLFGYLAKPTLAAFEQMNQALKHRAEQPSRTPVTS